MWSVVVFLLAALTIVEGGWPQCATAYEYCNDIISSEFSWALDRAERSRPIDETTSQLISKGAPALGAICNSENWVRREHCLYCPLKLIITEPPQLRMEICVRDNSFEPFERDAHIDIYHKLNGHETELILAGDDSGELTGCSPTEFEDGKNYTGKMVLIMRGRCYFHRKAQSAAVAGAESAIIINPSVTIIHKWKQLNMEGLSDGFSKIPVVSTYIYPITKVLAAMRRGTKIVGKLELSCTVPQNYNQYEENNCPMPYFVDMCNMPRFSLGNRLCSKCSFFIEVGEMDICVWGNDFYPKLKRNHILHNSKFPSLPFTSNEAVFIPHDGCDVSLFNSLVKDKLVFIIINNLCIPEAIEAIQNNGAKAIFSLKKDNNRPITFTSTFFNIPFHQIDTDNVTSVINYVTLNNAINGAPVYKIPGRVIFKTSSVRPFVHLLREEMVMPAAVLASSTFSWSVAIILSAVGIVFLSTINVVKYRGQAALNSGTKSCTKEEGYTVPLSAASMTLSVTLLVAIGCTAFVLAYLAGRKTCRTTRHNAQLAVSISHRNTADSLHNLNRIWRKALIEKAVSTTKNFLDTGVRLARSLSNIYLHYDETWQTFYPLHQIQKDIDYPWLRQIKMRNGFFSAGDIITDYGIGPMVRPPYVNTTHNGFLYDFVKVKSDEFGQFVAYENYLLRTQYEPLDIVGGTYVEPMKLIEGKKKNEAVFLRNPYNICFYEGISKNTPLSILVPIFTSISRDVPVGVVEIHRKSQDLSDSILRKIRVIPEAQNVTVIVLDRKTGILLCNSVSSFGHSDMFPIRDTYLPATWYFSLSNAYSLELRALGIMLWDAGNGSYDDGFGRLANDEQQLSGTFDQKDYYRDTVDHLVLKFDFEQRDDFTYLRDSTSEQWRAEMRDGSCHNFECTQTEKIRNGINTFMNFDGKSILYIYTNLTIDAKRVAATRIGNGTWQSSFTPWNSTIIYSDGTEVVARYAENIHKPVLRQEWTHQYFSISIWFMTSEVISDVKEPNDHKSVILFSNSEFGENRIYANGMWWLGVRNFGCATDPIKNGPRPFEWTHIFATRTVDGYCAVYINGLLHSKKRLSDTYAVTLNEEPYRLGVRFKGSMDEITIFNNTFSDNEVEEYYRVGVMRRDIPSKVWTYNLQQLTFDSVDYLVGLLIPEEDILRRIISNNEVLSTNLGIQEKNTSITLRQSTTEAIGILLVVTLGLVFIFLVFNDVLTRPFSIFLKKLTAAAAMKLEDDSTQVTFISEIKELEKAMQVMIRNLKEYRSFFPRTIFASVEQKSDTSQDEIISNTSSSRISSTTRSSRLPPKSGGRVLTSCVVSNNIKSAQDMRANLALSLTTRNATFLVINVVRFHELFEVMADSTVIELHGAFIEVAVSTITNNKGIPDIFSGDKVLANFNAVRQDTHHKRNACRAVLAMENLKKLPVHMQVAISMAVTSGGAKVGNMGTDGMKKFTCLSPSLTWAYALERVARYLSVPNLIDGSVQEDVETLFITQHLATVNFEKLQSKPIRVSKVVSDNSDTNSAYGEWMYAVPKPKSSPCIIWNNILKSIFSENWSDALAEFEHLDLTVAEEERIEFFRSCCRVKEYMPVQVLFN